MEACTPRCTYVQAMPPARRQPRRERLERTVGAGISTVSLFVSQPDRRGAKPGSSAEANHHEREAHKKKRRNAGTTLAAWARATPS
jgi:hypothetical protein